MHRFVFCCNNNFNFHIIRFPFITHSSIDRSNYSFIFSFHTAFQGGYNPWLLALALYNLDLLLLLLFILLLLLLLLISIFSYF